MKATRRKQEGEGKYRDTEGCQGPPEARRGPGQVLPGGFGGNMPRWYSESEVLPPELRCL